MITDLLSHEIFQAAATTVLLVICMMQAMFSFSFHAAVTTFCAGIMILKAPFLVPHLLGLDLPDRPESAVDTVQLPLISMLDGFLGFVGMVVIYALWAVLAGMVIFVLIKGVTLYRSFEFRVQLLQVAFRVLHWKLGISDPYAHLTVYLHKPDAAYEPPPFPEIEEIPAVRDET